MRLLLIEDDDILGEGLRDFLQGDGHAVQWCRSLAQLHGMRGEPFDAWLVDWQLPDGSGLQWLQAQRQLGRRTPALMLTARDQLGERVRCLDAGADDCLVKPFAPEELAARLRAVNRRLAGDSGAGVQVGAVRVDLVARAASLHGARVDLTGREWAVLEALLLRPGRVVSKADLERLVLGFDAAVASNAIEVHVSSLRRKLGHAVINTVRGSGYRAGAVGSGRG